MSRMTDEELTAYEQAVTDHNAAVAADIQTKMDELSALASELKVSDDRSAKLRDGAVQAVRVFNHQFGANVQPFLPADQQEPVGP